MRWEPAGRGLLAGSGDGAGLKAVDMAAGSGWLRVLSEWVGPHGDVTGTDVDDALIAAARARVETEGLANVTVLKDDLFSTQLPTRGFDLVHARFAVTPLDRVAGQIETSRASFDRVGGSSWRTTTSDRGTSTTAATGAEVYSPDRRVISGSGRESERRPSAAATAARNRAQASYLGPGASDEPGDPYLRLPPFISHSRWNRGC